MISIKILGHIIFYVKKKKIVMTRIEVCGFKKKSFNYQYLKK